ncbi:MAG: MATE family efflux transporter [Bacteroidales bacterium]|nr:MATE family efflux transporter [Bacteroidales bacterium]
MKDLTVGNSSRLIFSFAVPMLIGNVFQQFYNIADSIIVGKFIGKEALAAVGASFPLIFMLISFVVGVAMGTTVIIAQYYGAKDMKMVKKSMDTLYIFLFFASIVVTILGILFSKPIFRLINLPADIMPQAVTYFNVYLAGLIFFFGFNGTSAILRGLGDSKTPLYFLIISTVINIVLAVLFVAIFKWGVAGAAFATVIAQAGAFITGIIYLNRTHEVVKLSFRKLEFDWGIFKKSLQIGLPSGFQQTFVALGMLAVMRIVNEFGTDVIAAYSVAGRIDSLAGMPAMNFGVALSTFVGQNLGAGKTDRVKQGFKATLIMSSALALFTTLMVIIFPRALMGLFSSDPAVIEIGSHYLIIVGSFYVFFSTMFVVGGVMRGAGDTLIPMFITLFSLWIIRIPLAWVFSNQMGYMGIWWSIPIAWFVGMVLSYLYYLKGNWKKKVIVRPAKVQPEADTNPPVFE